MVDEPTDYPEEETDHEGAVLERVSRIRQWWELVMSLKKTIMLLLGFGAVSVAGNLNGTNYWHQVACEIGLSDTCIVSDETDTEPVVSDETVIRHTHSLPEHGHELKPHSHPSPEHDHEVEFHNHSHPEYAPAGHTHAPADHIHPELESMPENHEALH